MRAALARIDGLHFAREMDEYFYTACRDALLNAGPTEREVDGFAAWMVTRVVSCTRPHAEQGREQVELIANTSPARRCPCASAGTIPGWP
jgi:hypothetical protein